MEAPTHADTSRDRRKCTGEANRLMHDDRENVGAPTSHRRHKRSPYRYTGYMDLMSKCRDRSILIRGSSKKHVWVDAMVEESESIIIKSA